MWGEVDNFSNFTATINFRVLIKWENESISREFRGES